MKQNRSFLGDGFSVFPGAHSTVLQLITTQQLFTYIKLERYKQFVKNPEGMT